jgi:hypothetical protein
LIPNTKRRRSEHQVASGQGDVGIYKGTGRMTSGEVLAFTIYYSELDALDCRNDDSFFSIASYLSKYEHELSFASPSRCRIITNLTTTPLGDSSCSGYDLPLLPPHRDMANSKNALQRYG